MKGVSRSAHNFLYAKRFRKLRDLAMALPAACCSLLRLERTVDCYALFIGYSRSGSTLIGALLNSHPEAVIANELTMLQRLTPKTTKRALASRIVASDRAARLLTQYHCRGHSYAVPTQWQGTFRHLRVMGDKKCRGNTRQLCKDPAALDTLRQLCGGGGGG